MKFLTAFKADFLFQFKHGFYYIYTLLTLFYLLLLSQLDSTITTYVLPIIIFLDPSLLGLFFIGGILMLEKEQGILALTYITPLKLHQYLWSKVLALTLIALLAVTAITILSYQGPVNWWILLVATVDCSVFFSSFGIIIGAKSPSVNAYFIRMLPGMVILFVACILAFIFPHWTFLYFIPSVPAFMAIYQAFHEISSLHLFIYLIYTGLWAFVLFLFALKLFANEMILER